MSQHPTAVVDSPATAERGARIMALVADRLSQVETMLRSQIAADIPFVAEADRYLFDGGGKRVRPALLLLSAKLLDAETEDDITYAAVVELIRTATVIHDDIIDDAATRRGQAALHRRCGNSRTVLLGDWLYNTSMRMALSHDRLGIVRRLCDAILRMTEGEILVLERLGSLDVSRSEYFDIIERKTASLFAAACSIPALKCETDLEARLALEHYGRSLGRCFQLIDDVLDFSSDAALLGKPVLSDLVAGKLTLPLILLLPRIDSGRRRWIEWILEDGAFHRVEQEQILELVQREGTLDEVREIAAAEASLAREALEGFPASPARGALELAPEFILNRRT